jgi:hypothetical protein
MPAASLCYFVVCFTLQQCLDFSTQFRESNSQSPLDLFYWEQGAELDLPDNAFQLQDMIDSLPELQHWGTLAPVGAMHWIPYYYYYHTEHDSDSCSAFVKFTADVRPTDDYTNAILAGEFFALRRDRPEILVNLEPRCQPSLPLSAFNAVLNLHSVMEMLTYYQVDSQRMPLPIYSDDHLDRFLAQHSELLSSTSEDMTTCVDSAQESEKALFYKVPQKSPMQALAAEESRLGKSIGCPLALF